jgi:predicted ATPase
MIHALSIRGFKRYKAQRFELAPLTVLAGLNGSGKTTVIQALLLAQQASRRECNGTVELNGPFGLELGTAADIRNWETEEHLCVSVEYPAGRSSEWRFDVPSAEDALFLTRVASPTEVPTALDGRPRAFT